MLKCCNILARYPLFARSVTAPGQFGISKAWYLAPNKKEQKLTNTNKRTDHKSISDLTNLCDECPKSLKLHKLEELSKLQDLCGTEKKRLFLKQRTQFFNETFLPTQSLKALSASFYFRKMFISRINNMYDTIE